MSKARGWGRDVRTLKLLVVVVLCAWTGSQGSAVAEAQRSAPVGSQAAAPMESQAAAPLELQGAGRASSSGKGSGRLASATAAGEGSYVWKNVRVGGGGFAPDIVFSRAERGLAYLRTDMGGVYRWEVSAGSWVPLQDDMAESSYFGIESIAADPVDANVVYVAAGMYRRDQAAILRSRDRGNTWEVFPTSFRMGGNEDGRGVGERLAMDPNDRSILYFGSRHDGLQRSTNRGETWTPVASFPVRGRGVPESGRRTNAGISFVVFDAASGGRRSSTLFVGVADPGEQHLFRSDDAGSTWAAVSGQPRADLLPVRAELDDRGVLYIAYSNGVGPNGVTDGAVFKYDTHSGLWTDITPEKGSERAKGGYMGLSLDRQRPDTLIVASLNRWRPGDILWRSQDGGRTWRNLRESSGRDVAASPFLLWGAKEADFGWWMAGVAIDPFDSGFAAYTTGATVYATHDLVASGAGRRAAITWRPWVEGVEQTAVITLVSPPAGPALLSGFGDISGFAHEELTVSPSEQFTNPVFSNTNTIDYAGLSPNVVVRSGTPAPRAPPPTNESGAPTLAFSTDYGRTWSPLEVPSVSQANVHGVTEIRRYDLTGDRALVTSADGNVFMFMAPQPLITRDHGKTWTQVTGLPAGARPIADRADGRVFYALDFERSGVFVSTDGGQTFASLRVVGLPADIRADQPTWREAPWPLVATPGKRGDLWLVSRAGLFHSGDGGRSFRDVSRGLNIKALSFGRAPPGRDYPAMFALGARAETYGIWRSDDVGASWMRVNDARHEYGRRFRCISGDPRVFGRVYIGTDGRGIVYGEPRPAHQRPRP